MPMIDRSAPVPPNLCMPAWHTRVMFALGRHPTAATLIFVSLFFVLAVGNGTLLVSLTDPRQKLALAMAAICSIAGLTILAIIQPWLSRLARPGDIAAALRAATTREQPHLLAAIEGRLGNPFSPQPITLSELCTLFAETREEHGDRVRRRRAKVYRARAAQRSALARLADAGTSYSRRAAQK